MKNFEFQGALGPLGPGTRAWDQEQGPRARDQGTRAQGPGPGPRARDQGQGPRARDQGQGPRDKGPGARDQGQGPRARGQGTRAQGPGPRDKGPGPGTRDKGMGPMGANGSSMNPYEASWPPCAPCGSHVSPAGPAAGDPKVCEPGPEPSSTPTWTKSSLNESP